jgi:putative membrane protein insertion efficiency factor
MQKILIGAIRLYSYLISPFLGPCCRFYPSCSAYAREAIEKYGACKGTVMTAKRLCRCHPFHPGGHDPVR